MALELIPKAVAAILTKSSGYRVPSEFLSKVVEAIITKDVPIFANLFLTRRCNLRCAKCRVIQRVSPELDIDDWKNVIDKIHDLGTRWVSLTGGEPLIRRDILPGIIKYLRKKGFVFYLATNGVLLDKDCIRELIDSGLKSMGFTLDSLDALKEVQMGRGQLTTNKVKEILLWYKSDQNFRENLSIAVSSVLTRENVEEVPEIIRFASEYGSGFVLNFLQSDISERWWLRSYAPELELQEGDRERVINLINEIIKMKRDGYPVVGPIEYLEDGLKYILNGRTLRCRAGELFFSVNSDGKIMPCQDLPPLDWADLTKIENLKESWKDISRGIKRARSTCPGCFWECYYMVDYMVNHPLKYLISRLRARTEDG